MNKFKKFGNDLKHFKFSAWERLLVTLFVIFWDFYPIVNLMYIVFYYIVTAPIKWFFWKEWHIYAKNIVGYFAKPIASWIVWQSAGAVVGIAIVIVAGLTIIPLIEHVIGPMLYAFLTL